MASMVEGMLPKWDWETIPEYLDSLERAPLGVNCIQYMPTASLMTYVMGLEAAKTRPATDAERKEMQRLLHEGMDAGLVRLLDPAPRPELHPGRLRRHADGDRHDVRRGHPLPRPRCCAERDEGFIQITQATGDTQRRRPGVPGEAGRGGRSGRSSTTRSPPATKNPEIHRRAPALARASARAKGLPIFGQTATLRTGFAFTLEHWNLYDASPAWRDVTTGTQGGEDARRWRDPALREAVHATRPRKPTDACSGRSRPASAARRAS